MKPVTRKEAYWAAMADDSITPPEPQTTEECILAAMSGNYPSDKIEPQTREQELMKQAAVKITKDVVWTADTVEPKDEVSHVVIPDGITKIAPAAFSGYAKLESVEGTESVKYIDVGAFSGCTSLTTVSFPGVKRISAGAFSSCSHLTTVSFPSVTYIDGGAFSGTSFHGSGGSGYYRTGVAEFDFPELVKLGDGATGNGYRKISLPKCEDLGCGNFGGQQVATVLENEDGSRNDLYLPECRRIGNGSCSGFKAKNIILPAIEEIEKHCFNASEFEAFIMSNPEIVCKLTVGAGQNFNNTTFDETHGWFYVPKHLLDQYKAEWSDHADRFRAIEDYPEICG